MVKFNQMEFYLTILDDNLLLGKVASHAIQDDVHDGVSVVLALATTNSTTKFITKTKTKTKTTTTATKGVRKEGVKALSSTTTANEGQ